MSIESRVIKVLELQLGLPNGEVTINSDKYTLGMDSLDDIECLMIIEEEFDLEIPDADGEKLESVQQVIDYIIPLVN